MSKLAWSASEGVVLVNYADDFLLLAQNLKLLDDAAEKLTKAAAELPGGNFVLAKKMAGKADLGFEFLGHLLQLKEGKLRTALSPKNDNILTHKLAALERPLKAAILPMSKKAAPDKEAATSLLAELLAFIESWKLAFSECDDLDEYVLSTMLDFQGWLAFAKQQFGDFTIEQVTAAIDTSMEYEFGPYELSQ